MIVGQYLLYHSRHCFSSMIIVNPPNVSKAEFLWFIGHWILIVGDDSIQIGINHLCCFQVGTNHLDCGINLGFHEDHNIVFPTMVAIGCQPVVPSHGRASSDKTSVFSTLGLAEFATFVLGTGGSSGSAFKTESDGVLVSSGRSLPPLSWPWTGPRN